MREISALRYIFMREIFGRYDIFMREIGIGASEMPASDEANESQHGVHAS